MLTYAAPASTGCSAQHALVAEEASVVAHHVSSHTYKLDQLKSATPHDHCGIISFVSYTIHVAQSSNTNTKVAQTEMKEQHGRTVREHTLT